MPTDNRTPLQRSADALREHADATSNSATRAARQAVDHLRTSAREATGGAPEDAPDAEQAVQAVLASALVALRAADSNSPAAWTAWTAGVSVVRGLSRLDGLSSGTRSALRRAVRAVSNEDHAEAVRIVEDLLVL